MKLLPIVYLLMIASCAHERRPASTQNSVVAHGSMALGNIKASATKVKDNKDVCFDISLKMKGVDQQDASSANWTLAWVDKDSRYHLLTLNQRDPASVPIGGQKIAPYGTFEEWTNTFRTCASQTSFDEVKSIVLTPRSLPYKKHEGIILEWK